MRRADATSPPLRRCLLPVASAVAFGLCSNGFTWLNSDLGWILTFGSDTLATGHLPATNGYSFVEPNHPVVMHEWLACVVLAAAHRLGGAAALIAVKWASIALTLVIIAAALRQIIGSVAVLWLTLLAVVLTTPMTFYFVRPQLASWVLLAFVVSAALSGSRGALWCCVPAFLLWGNLHGGVLMGVAVLALLCSGLFLEQRLGSARTGLRTAELLGIPLLAALVTLVNPYGVDLPIHTWHHATDPVRLLNHEWLPLWRDGPLEGYERFALAAYAVILLLAAWLLPWRSVRLWLLVGIAVATGLSANRHLRMSAILLAPPVAVMAERLLLRLTERRRAIIDRATQWAALVPLVLYGGLWAADLGKEVWFLDPAELNPGSALWVMRANGITGKVWNDFNWGGLLMWVVPETKLACDGRNVAAYSDETLQVSAHFGEEPDPVKAIEDRGADIVFLPRRHAALEKLTPKFPVIYCDDVACILSNRPDLQAKARAGLRLPPSAVYASDFFIRRGRPFLKSLPLPALPGSAR